MRQQNVVMNWAVASQLGLSTWPYPKIRLALPHLIITITLASTSTCILVHSYHAIQSEAKSTALIAAGFRRGGWNSPPLSPRNLEVEYGYYCAAINISYLVLCISICQQNVWKVCPGWRQKQSERT